MNPEPKRLQGPKRWVWILLLLLAGLIVDVVLVYPIARAVHDAKAKQNSGR